MTTSGAYPDEMRRFLGLTDEDLSRLLAGEAGSANQAFEEVAGFLDDVRATYSAGPDDHTKARHLAAITETSRFVAEGNEPAGRLLEVSNRRTVMESMRSLLLKGAAGVIAVSLSTIGMAYAGVDLPGTAAADAIEAVTGVELPNQEGDAENEGTPVSDAVKAVLDGDLEGCELGQAVADAADANRQNEGDGESEDPCEQGEHEDEAQGSRATGEEKSKKGRERASEASEGRSDNPGSAGDNAADHAENGSGNGSGQTNKPTDPGRTTGDEKSEEGRANNPSGSGAPGGTSDDDGDTEDTEDGAGTGVDGASNNPTGKGPSTGDAASDAGQGNNPNK